MHTAAKRIPLHHHRVAKHSEIKIASTQISRIGVPSIFVPRRNFLLPRATKFDKEVATYTSSSESCGGTGEWKRLSFKGDTNTELSFFGALLLLGGLYSLWNPQSDAAQSPEDLHARKAGDTIEAVATRWDRMSKHWNAFSSTSTTTAHVLINQLQLATANSVLEVGCGLGDGSHLASQFLSPSAKMISTDLSPEMVAGAKSRFASKLQSQVSFQVANAEQLPFSDGKFDRYMANFVLHLTPDPQRMAREAARVLQRGGIAAFSVWGRPSESPQISVVPESARAVGITMPSPTWRSPAHLGVNSEETRKILLDAGFSRVIAWYINQPLPCTTGECVVDTLMHSTQGDLVAQLTPAQRASWRTKAIEISDNFYNKGKPMPFEVLVLVAVK